MIQTHFLTIMIFLQKSMGKYMKTSMIPQNNRLCRIISQINSLEVENAVCNSALEKALFRPNKNWI